MESIKIHDCMPSSAHTLQYQIRARVVFFVSAAAVAGVLFVTVSLASNCVRVAEEVRLIRGARTHTHCEHLNIKVPLGSVIQLFKLISIERREKNPHRKRKTAPRIEHAARTTHVRSAHQNALFS